MSSTMGRRKRSAGKLTAWPAGMSLARWRLHAKACLAAQSSATGLAKPDKEVQGSCRGAALPDTPKHALRCVESTGAGARWMPAYTRGDPCCHAF